jgi:hypothetical protein
MKNKLTLFFATIAWFAVLAQYYLMIENRVASFSETTIRFFSFFTILSNTLVAIYFTVLLQKNNTNNQSIINMPGTLTAITVYISIVGLVYQFVLRQIWEPQGLQKIVDELLHSIIPILVFIFWFLYEEKKLLSYKQIPQWLIFPFVYLIYILIRGYYSNFYPYPFVDVVQLGLNQVMMNSAGLILFFIFISVGYVALGKLMKSQS